MAEHDTMRDQEVAEDLDADKLPGEFPPEEPMGVEDYGVTAREEAVEEPIEERVTREEPEAGGSGAEAAGAGEAGDRPVGALVEPDEGAGPDVEQDAVAREALPGESERREAGDIASGDGTLRDVATERPGDGPAEEAAMHETEEPPLGDPVPPEGSGDDYIER